MEHRRRVYVGVFTVFALFLFLRSRSTSELSPKLPETEDDAKVIFQRKIVAIGDLHGDYPHALQVLQLGNVVDKDGNWTGKVDYLVQTGDIVGEGDDTIKLFRWFETLREQAQGAGGDLLSGLGNHEIMNAIGDWRYVPQSEIKTFGGVAARQKIMSSGWMGKAWKDNYTVTNRLPYHPSVGQPNTDFFLSDFEIESHGPSAKFVAENGDKIKHQSRNLGAIERNAALSFVHGGISPQFSTLQPYPGAINRLGSTLLRKLQDRKQPPPHPPNPYPGLPYDTTPAESDLYGADGPLWFRGWAQESDAWVCANVGPVIKRLGVRRLIMGHTPTFTNMVSRCDGKIIIIDTGISSAYGGVLSALSITYTITQPQGAKVGEWVEHELIKALYVDKEEVVFVDEKNSIRGSLT